MTQTELNGKVIYICEQAKLVAIAHGDHVTRCEIVEEIPKYVTPIDPVIEELKT